MLGKFFVGDFFGIFGVRRCIDVLKLMDRDRDRRPATEFLPFAHAQCAFGT